MTPIPDRLAGCAWYAPHLEWLRQRGIDPRHDPGDAEAVRANLRAADLRMADLRAADLRAVDLDAADLRGVDLRRANLRRANLRGANLYRADLREANLGRASLGNTCLRKADLRAADLLGADLLEADLLEADLRGAVLPDGRSLAEWQADPLAGLCTEPEAVERARAAWGAHTWQDCPMHAAHGWAGIGDAPEDKRVLVATFVALFDGEHLPAPGGAE